MMIALKKSGPKKVAIRNHFERTRSRYSRLMIAQSLAMSGHPLFDALSADLLQKDLVQRRLDHLESLYGCAGLDNASQQSLWISARHHLDLEKAVRIVCALHERVVPENRSDALHSIALDRE